MSAFEYLSVLISIILAFGMTRVLAGVGEIKISPISIGNFRHPSPKNHCRCCDWRPGDGNSGSE
jgi:hypothetical protein